jgi:hypothetical protein
MVSPPPRTWVYLYRSAGLSGGLSKVSPALLELTDSTVRCILTSNRGYSRWLAKRLHIPDLKQRIKAGEQVTVFEFPRTGYRIKWPKLATGTLFKIGQGDARDWVVGFDPPRNQASAAVLDSHIAAEPGVLGAAGDVFLAADTIDDAASLVGFVRGHDARKQWRQALDPTGQLAPSSSQRPDATSAAPQQQTPSALPPPGWYPDPADARAQRYWNGTQWTSSTQPPPYPGHP